MKEKLYYETCENGITIRKTLYITHNKSGVVYTAMYAEQAPSYGFPPPIYHLFDADGNHVKTIKHATLRRGYTFEAKKEIIR